MWDGAKPYKIKEAIIALTLDFTKKEIKENLKGFKPLAKGPYPGAMVSYEEAIAESSGQPKVKVTYVIDAAASDGAGRQIIKDYSMQPKALWRWVNDMTALGGVPSDYFDDNSKVDVAKVCEANVNRKGILVLDEPTAEEIEKGWTSNKLAKVRPLR